MEACPSITALELFFAWPAISVSVTVRYGGLFFPIRNPQSITCQFLINWKHSATWLNLGLVICNIMHCLLCISIATSALITSSPWYLRRCALRLVATLDKRNRGKQSKVLGCRCITPKPRVSCTSNSISPPTNFRARSGTMTSITSYSCAVNSVLVQNFAQKFPHPRKCPSPWPLAKEIFRGRRSSTISAKRIRWVH